MPSFVSVPFSPDLDPNFEAFPAQPAVFALYLRPSKGERISPYLGRTQDLRRRLARLLRPNGPLSKLLNLRDFTSRISYRAVGSQFEALWWLYQLNREHYPQTYLQRLRLKRPVFLKVNLKNRFPRCYPTRRISDDGSLYYGPFVSRPAAERFASDFLDLFKIRRCVEDLDPDPSHPGCIYSQMHMCLAPCFAGCTDEAYQQEVASVVSFLNSSGGSNSVIASLEVARTRASESLEFEEAARVHRRIEKMQDVIRQRTDIVRNLSDLDAIIIERGALPKTVVFFRVRKGNIRGPVSLGFDENVASPVPLDQQLHSLLDPLGSSPSPLGPKNSAAQRDLPPWEHLSLLTRWYYSSFRTGEILMLGSEPDIPHKRLIRLCHKLGL